MAEDLKALIEKINQEGIQAAQEKARVLESEAKRRAEEIVEKAELEAQRLIAEAKEKISRTQESARVSLGQAGRDTLLALRKEINALLNKIIALRLRQALSPNTMIKIISALIKAYNKKEEGAIVVLLKKQDLKKLKNGLLAELKEELRKGVTLKSSDEVGAGFVISYDGGKSHFDFSDQALTEYIGTYLKPQLTEILQAETPVVFEKKLKKKIKPKKIKLKAKKKIKRKK